MAAKVAVLVLVLAAHQKATVSALDNGVALTPPRGFSTWNAYPTTGISEATSRRCVPPCSRSDPGSTSTWQRPPTQRGGPPRKAAEGDWRGGPLAAPRRTPCP